MLLIRQQQDLQLDFTLFILLLTTTIFGIYSYFSGFVFFFVRWWLRRVELKKFDRIPLQWNSSPFKFIDASHSNHKNNTQDTCITMNFLTKYHASTPVCEKENTGKSQKLKPCANCKKQHLRWNYYYYRQENERRMKKSKEFLSPRHE